MNYIVLIQTPLTLNVALVSNSWVEMILKRPNKIKKEASFLRFV